MHSVMTCSVNQKKKKDLLPKISPFVFASSTPAPFPSSCAATSSDETYVPTIQWQCRPADIAKRNTGEQPASGASPRDLASHRKRRYCTYAITSRASNQRM